jgi:CheY-like chemotaxis protein
MSSMYSQLTAIAMNNTDPQLRERIKNVMVLLRDAQSDFSDLIEIATHVDRTRTAPWLDATQMWEDIERDIKRLSDTEAMAIYFALTRMGPTGDSAVTPAGVLLNIDGVRLKKAILYLCRALGRSRQESGVHVNAELIRFSAEHLHVSVHIVAFGAANTHVAATPWIKALGSNGNGVPAALGLRDRESKIIDYLLRAIGANLTVGFSPAATVNVLLDVTCGYSVEPSRTPIVTDWMFSAPPVSATLVSNDLSLVRYTTRADLSNHELKFLTFSQALLSPTDVHGPDALLIDISDDIADVLALLDSAKDLGISLPPLVAICPPGIVSDSFATRLFELGFVGMVQKPLQYSRLIEVIREALAQPLAGLGIRGRFSPPDGSP